MALELTEHVDRMRFRDAVLGRLLEAEAENCVQVGLVQRLAAGEYAPVPDELDRPLLATVSDGGRIDLVAIQTARSRLIVTRGSTAAIELLADWLARRAWAGDGIIGVCPSVAGLVERYAATSGRPARLAVRLRAFATSTVVPPPPVPGRPRPCVAADRHALGSFIDAFEAEIGEPSLEDGAARADRSIAAGRIYFWDVDGQPVAMAGWAGPTPNGVRVNSVYTPPAHRGRGYASNLVAGLTRQLLDAGRRSCFLFTDLSNPVSNGIYQRLGYRPVADSERWTFG